MTRQLLLTTVHLLSAAACAVLPDAALRLMEVRDAYSRTDFEWDQLQRLSTEAVKKSNLQLMRQAAAASLQATVDREPQPVPAAEQQQQEQAGTAHKPSAGSISSNSSGTDSRASKEESSAAASSSGTNQGSALQPGAGKPQVVEKADSNPGGCECLASLQIWLWQLSNSS